MNTDLRAGSLGRSLLAILVVGVVGGGLGACTTQEARPMDGGAGTTGGGTGGGGGGSTPTGGVGGWAINDGVLCPLPSMALINDFTYSADAGSTTSVKFGAAGAFSGDHFAYPTGGTYPVTSSVTGNNWHMTGNIGDYSGFGLSFDNCNRLNASAYRGISFTISGSVALGNMVTMGSATLNNRIAASWLIAHPVPGMTPTLADPGRCIPNAAAANQYAQSDCVDAIKVIPVTATPTTQTILWTDFAGGKPEANVSPGDITTIYWFFPPPTGAGTANPTPYAADITIDNLSFVQ